LRALFTQSNLTVGQHLIQGGHDVQVTINESRHHIPLILAMLAVVAIIALAAFYFVSRATSQSLHSPATEGTTKLTGQVDDTDGNPIAGATVKVDEITDHPSMQTTTTSSGGFIVGKIPASNGDRVRVYVSKEGYVSMEGVEKHDQYVTLPGPLPTVKLKRKK
jgi:hypothetical protein